MELEYFAIDGEEVVPGALQVRRAREFAALIADGATPFVELVTCSQASNGSETVIIEVRPTVPQQPAVAIRRRERLSVRFTPADDWYPDVRALRRDFPRDCVLHLNLVPSDQPASLCHFSEPWPDVRLLTANELLFRIQTWLSDTASGTLHREDQPLEPAFIAQSRHLIISPTLAERVVQGTNNLDLGVIEDGSHITYIERRPDRRITAPALPGVVIPLVSRPHEHCLINSHPRTLEELHEHLLPAGLDILEAVQKKLLELEHAKQLRPKGFILLLIAMLRKRHANAEPEPDIVAFVCIGEDAQTTGLQGFARAVGLDGTADMTRRGQKVSVTLMRVHHEISPATAALYSGYDEFSGRLVAVGAGALGSQVVLQAVRGGLTAWTVVDDDILLPHNLVRHGLTGEWLGHEKAPALASAANSLLDQNVVTPIVADVLDPGGQAEAISEAFGAASAIVDMSASVAVARHLALEVNEPAKRCSLFVSPSGRDLVVLGEDRERNLRLDILEAQYYRAVATDPTLAGHLQGGTTIGSCRTVTSRVPQDLMGLHAAQGVRAFRRWLPGHNAVATVVRTAEGSAACAEVSVEIGRSLEVGMLGDWTVLTDERFLAEVQNQRLERLPNECGGVLLAQIDVQRRIVYVVHDIPAPPDSECQPTMYIRGCTGLEEEYERIRTDTLNNLAYIGEWHSHPDGAACAPSEDDLLAGVWLAERTRVGSLPGIMLIVGEGGATCWMLCGQSRADAPITLSLASRRYE